MRHPGLALLLLAGCSAAEREGSRATTSLVAGLAVGEVSLNQGVKVSLMSGGQLVAGAPPVVAGRAGLLRVAVQPALDWKPREVLARLELASAAGPVEPLEVRSFVAGPSSDADLGTTFNFELGGELLTPGASFAVALHEVTGPTERAPSPDARFPAQGLAPVPAQSTAGPLRMVLVPLQYDADGSGRLPVLDDAQIALYRTALERLYPTPGVEIRVREPIAYDQPVSPSGEGWGELLQFLLVRRNQDRITNEAASNEYYYGLLMPTPSFAQYCASSPICVLGLSAAVADPTTEFVRGSVGVGFPGSRSADTLAHETGHAHGRLHAPCAPGNFIQNTDAAFPYPGGTIGTWGYDMSSKVLIDPSGPARDFMGYCEPAWVSDYTWRGLFERIAHVNSTASTPGGGGGGGEPMWMVSLDAAGRATLGPRVELVGEPSGELSWVDVLDEAGTVRRRDPAWFHPYSHLPGGFALVRAPEPGDRSFRIGPSTVRWGGPGNPLPSR